MRESVGTRGAAGSTFDVVAREAGRLARPAALLLRLEGAAAGGGRPPGLRRPHRGARSGARPGRLGRRDRRAPSSPRWRPSSRSEPGTQAVLYEMVSASHHSDEIRAEMAELYRRWRAHLAEALRAEGARGRRQARRRRGRGGLDPLRAGRRARAAAELRPAVGERGLAGGRDGRGAAVARGGGVEPGLVFFGRWRSVGGYGWLGNAVDHADRPVWRSLFDPRTGLFSGAPGAGAA